MPNTLSPLTYAEIDLNAYAHNLRNLRAYLTPDVAMMAIVKANAYGHGAVPIARRAIQVGASHLGVARVSEGVELRQAGIGAPIIVLYYSAPEELPLAADHDLTPTLNSQQALETWSQQAARLGKTLSFHVMIDTGMGTFGQLVDETLPFVSSIQQYPNIRLEGLFTHFATADEADAAFTQKQIQQFHDILMQLSQTGIEVPLRHAANSAGVLHHQQAYLNMVRPGLVSYGLIPNEALDLPFVPQPVMAIKSRLARVRALPAGSSVGYGRTFITHKPTPIGLVPIGYGDGYHRLISNRGYVLVDGQKAPIVGRVSMDQITVDLSNAPQATENAEVVILGQQGQQRITAEDIARWAETINYEVTTSILPRVPRVYIGVED